MSWLEDQIFTIGCDRISGSLEILDEIIGVFEKYARESQQDTITNSDWEKIIRKAGEIFKSFPVVRHFVECIGQTDGTDRVLLLEVIESYRSDWDRVDQNIADRAASILDVKSKTLLVHSHSRTLKTFFEFLAESQIYVPVFQTESRPLMEGRIQARILDRLGHRVTLITDAQAASAFRGADLVLSGADAVYKDGFVNKVGTMNLAILAHHFSTPLYVLFDSRKFNEMLMGKDFVSDVQNPNEIWDEMEGKVQIQNFYFEFIPGKYVTRFISESR